MMRPHFLALFALLPAACSLRPDLVEQPPALADMEEPLDLRAEPDDESARVALPAGAFSGIYLRDARETLEAKLNDPEAVAVDRVVENSPAAAAGLQPGDLLLEVQIGAAEPRAITTESQWRRIELETAPGTTLTLIVDRAGREAETALTLTARIRPSARESSDRFREEQRVGCVFRTATEVEARAAGLGPGGGAVIVGMSAQSPWRAAGLRFGDIVTAVDGVALTLPQQLLVAVRDATEDELQLTYWRADRTQTVTAPLTNRASTINEISLPPLFSYQSERGQREWSLLLGLLSYRSTAAAWRVRLLWLIGFGGGDADELRETGA